MGFIKQWLARHTTKPSDFARAYTSGLIVFIDHFTASLLAFSGRSEVFVEGAKTVFENTFDMEQAGFEPLTKDISIRIAPSIEELKATADYDLLSRAFKSTTAFLCLYSENAAHRYMKPENATLFSTALYQFVAERCTC